MVDASEQLRKVETALNKISLGTLAQKFCDEKLDFETLLATSDTELTRLGVVTSVMKSGKGRAKITCLWNAIAALCAQSTVLFRALI